MACMKLPIVFFVYFSVALKTFAQDKEPPCSERWSLEYELDNKGKVPSVLETLTNKTFNTYTITIKDCESDDEKGYTLDEQYIWDLRFHLYNDTYDAIVSCRNCSNTLELFRRCMADVRDTMESILQGWDSDIQAHLNEIKEEAEKNCVK